MTSSTRTLNFTNNEGEYVNEAVPDERTPLLKKESARFNDVVPCVAEIDEEAAQALVDKSPLQEESTNIAGVISILLIGVSEPECSEGLFSSSWKNLRRLFPLKLRLTAVPRSFHRKCRYFACPCDKRDNQQRVQ